MLCMLPDTLLLLVPEHTAVLLPSLVNYIACACLSLLCVITDQYSLSTLSLSLHTHVIPTATDYLSCMHCATFGHMIVIK